MKKIIIVDPIHPESITQLKSVGFQVDIKTDLNENEIASVISSYHALIGRTSTQITSKIIASAKQLECIGVHATGWNHIDVEAATKQGIKLLGYPADPKNISTDKQNGSFIPVAEYVLMTMLATAKRLIEADNSMKDKQWNKYTLSGNELYGKTLGIIGLGRIGSLVAERASAFGMKVIAHHPRLTFEEAKSRGAELTSLNNIFSNADFITVHTPQTKETIDLINTESFTRMNKCPVLINTSRAPVINENAILDALNNNLIKAAVLDVFSGAPNNVNWELAGHPKVIATPHIAGVTEESLKRVSAYITKLVTDYLKYGETRGLINNK